MGLTHLDQLIVSQDLLVANLDNILGLGLQIGTRVKMLKLHVGPFHKILIKLGTLLLQIMVVGVFKVNRLVNI